MLARYHRWIFENCKQESVLTLRTWTIQRSRIPDNCIRNGSGLSGKVVTETIARTRAKNKYQRTFFGDANGNCDVKKLLCKVSGSSHGAWTCAKFMHLPDRWDTAKVLQLCFLCLGDNHFGRSRPRSRQCGQNGCRELHHKLLHKSGSTELKRPFFR